MVDVTLMSVALSSSTTAVHPRRAAAQWQVGVRETLLQQLHVKGEQLEGNNETERDAITKKFLEQRGANQTSRSWPTRQHREGGSVARAPRMQ